MANCASDLESLRKDRVGELGNLLRLIILYQEVVFQGIWSWDKSAFISLFQTILD